MRKIGASFIQMDCSSEKENKDKRVVFILNNNPCTAAEASVGGGANLDTLESVVRIFTRNERAWLSGRTYTEKW